MKKNYQKPQTQAVNIRTRQQFLAGSVQTTSTNAELNYRGGGHDEAMSRSYDDWDDEE